VEGGVLAAEIVLLAFLSIPLINGLNLPVGNPVIIQLSSKEIVHSLGMPQMRVKHDAIPGIA